MMLAATKTKQGSYMIERDKGEVTLTVRSETGATVTLELTTIELARLARELVEAVKP
jgi:hypothetical protein